MAWVSNNVHQYFCEKKHLVVFFSDILKNCFVFDSCFIVYDVWCELLCFSAFCTATSGTSTFLVKAHEINISLYFPVLFFFDGLFFVCCLLQNDLHSRTYGVGVVSQVA